MLIKLSLSEYTGTYVLYMKTETERQRAKLLFAIAGWGWGYLQGCIPRRKEAAAEF